MKVIIVEDDAGIRDALQMVFENAGFDVTALEDGMGVLEDKIALPDIFIIDKQLSGVDGLDVCRYVKTQERSKAVPVIIISASPDTEKAAMLACADAFLEKPFRNKDLLQKVNELTANAKV